MRIFKSILSFLTLIIIYEALTLGAVTWSFVESVKSSFVMIEYAATHNAANILKGLSSGAETFVLAKNQNRNKAKNSLEEIDSTFRHFIKDSILSKDRLLIKEIFIIDNKGVLLAHSESTRKNQLNKVSPDYNKAIYKRANNLSKWKVTDPIELGTFKAEDRISAYLFQLIPGLHKREMLISTPVYQPNKLISLGSIHLIYELDNFKFFLERQLKLYQWLLLNFAVISFGAGFLVWLFFFMGNHRSRSIVEGKTNYSQDPPFITRVVAPYQNDFKTDGQNEEEELLSIADDDWATPPESLVEKMEGARDIYKATSPINVALIQERHSSSPREKMNKKEIQDAIFLG